MVQVMREGEYFTIRFARKDVSDQFLEKLLNQMKEEHI